jgi:hypothetical protein
VGCKVDDFSISEKTKTSKIIAVKMEAMVRAMVMARARARKMTAKTTMKDTAKTKKSPMGVDEIYIMKCNIDTMIRMLFPTTFPLSENLDSFCQYIKGKNRVLLH